MELGAQRFGTAVYWWCIGRSAEAGNWQAPGGFVKMKEVDRAEYFSLEEIVELEQVPPVNLEAANSAVLQNGVALRRDHQANKIWGANRFWLWCT